MAGLIQWDPFAGLTNLHSQLDDMFGHFLSSAAGSHGTAAIDVYSDGKSLVAEVHAPGFDKKDIDVHVHNGVLEIKGEKHTKEEEDGKKRSYMLRESHASFYRSIALPKGADDAHVAAKLDNGVLTVTVPLKELPAAKKVTIEDGESAKK